MNVSPIFINHYQTKLPLENPQFDILLVVIFSFLVLLSIKKSNKDYPLSITQTNQVKGLAILFIVSNHLCYYTEPPPSLYAIWSEAGMIGVAIFFIFSGYGICISIQERGIGDFFRKRMIRIFIPLIYAMSLLLALHVTLMPEIQNGFLIEMPRILFSMESLDGKMWFIAFVLSWYCLLYVTAKLNLCNIHKLFLLLIFSFAIITIPDMPYMAKGNAFSFPFGCWLGFNHSTVLERLDKFLLLRFKIIIISFASLLALTGISFWLAETLKFYAYQTIFVMAMMAVIISCMYLLYQYRFEEIKQSISLEIISCAIVFSTIYFNYLSHVFQRQDFEGTLFLMYWSTARSLANILIASSLTLMITLMVKYQRSSSILNFLGWISFELYLVHNTFMIHFDILLFRGPMTLMFPIYFLSVCLISLMLKRLSDVTLRILRNAKEFSF